MTDLLVFAVVPADRFDPAFLAVGEGLPSGLRSIAVGALAAIVGPAPEGDVGRRERGELLSRLLASQKVMEWLLASSPVLPVALGTVVEDEDRIRHALGVGASVLHGALDAVGDRVEMNLSVLWRLDMVVARLLAEVAPKLRAAAADGDEPAREALGVVLAGLVAAERQKTQRRVVERLRSVTRDITITEPAGTDCVVSLALLVDREMEGALVELLETLDAEFDGSLTFRLVGPLAPYSFASVQLNMAPAETVRGARIELGVEQDASPQDVKAAYRQAARRVHPDLVHQDASTDATAPAGEETRAPARFLALTDAYRVLKAEYEPVSLRRQETAPLD